MFLYKIGTFDNFNGMVKLNDYIKLCYSKKENKYDCYLSYKELKVFLTKCFISLKMDKIGWEGDIRKNEIYISIVNFHFDDNNNPYKSIILKQDNGGICFVASEFPLGTIDEYNKNREPLHISHKGFYDSFDNSYDLVETIFENALNDIIDKSKNIESDGLKLVYKQKNHHSYQSIINDFAKPIEKKDKEEEINLNDKFNENDYESF